MREGRPSLQALLQVCIEQLRLCEDAAASASQLAELLERKEHLIRGFDFGQLQRENAEARAHAEEIIRLEEESLRALERHRDGTASELRNLLSAKTAREGYLERNGGARGARLFDRDG